MNTNDKYQVVYYNEKFDEYGIVMPEDGNSNNTHFAVIIVRIH